MLSRSVFVVLAIITTLLHRDFIWRRKKQCKVSESAVNQAQSVDWSVSA